MASVISYTKDKIDQLLKQLSNNIENKASKQHTHTIPQIEYLQDALDAKARKDHTHQIPDVEGLEDALNNQVNPAHKHNSAEIVDCVALITKENAGKITKIDPEGRMEISDDSIVTDQSLVNKKFVEYTAKEIADNIKVTGTWIGTKVEYDQIAEKDPEVAYIIKDK